ncbi:hypothetical protein ElyMa_002060800 [Elysia marginata]|uniref:Uncharacterized protein n=1 Tax=Elysia marginata TaxID=1093978 RepID=A0AAV4FAY5_9GAST|nr:hypothetical protein ElyMa_002060800 [Elysia marginata]
MIYQSCNRKNNNEFGDDDDDDDVKNDDDDEDKDHDDNSDDGKGIILVCLWRRGVVVDARPAFESCFRQVDVYSLRKAIYTHFFASLIP